MKTPNMLTAASLAAIVLLTACESDPVVIGGSATDPQAEALKNAPPVELPPAIQSSTTYRCRDNSIVYVNVLTNGTVNLRLVENEPPRQVLTRETPDGPFTGGGFSLSGTGSTVTFSSPDVRSQSCRSNAPS